MMKMWGGGVSSQLEDGSVRARIVGKCDKLGRNNSTLSALKPYLTFVNVENTSPIKNGRAIFNEFKIINSVDGRIFENVLGNCYFYQSFRVCSNLAEIPSDLFQYNSNALSFQECFYGSDKTKLVCINLWNASKFTNFIASYQTPDIVCYNIPTDDARVMDFINVLPQGGNGTIFIKKTIPEARDTLTAEQEAALNARGWVLETETKV